MRLLEGSLIPSLTNAVQEIMAPDPDFEAVLRNNAGTLRTLEAAAAEDLFGDALARPTEKFRLGLEALELIVADDPTTISDARADISMHLSMLEEIAAGPPAVRDQGPLAVGGLCAQRA